MRRLRRRRAAGQRWGSSSRAPELRARDGPTQHHRGDPRRRRGGDEGKRHHMIATARHWATRLRLGRALLLAIGAAVLIGFVILIVNLSLGQLGCPYLFGLIKPFCGTHIGW